MYTVKKYDEFIKESVWGNISKRADGSLDRKENLVGNMKSVKDLAQRVIDALKLKGFQSDFNDAIELVLPNDSPFYCNQMDSFDIEIDDEVYAAKIGIKKESFEYQNYIFVPYHLYVSDVPLQINDYENVMAWFDFGYGDENDYETEELEPASFYYDPEQDKWMCDVLQDPQEADDKNWIKRILSIISPVLNPDTKIK